MVLVFMEWHKRHEDKQVPMRLIFKSYSSIIPLLNSSLKSIIFPTRKRGKPLPSHLLTLIKPIKSKVIEHDGRQDGSEGDSVNE